MKYEKYEIYELLKKLMEAMIKGDKAIEKELREELKAYLTDAESFSGEDFADELFDVMGRWAKELRKSRRFKDALLDFIEWAKELRKSRRFKDALLDFIDDAFADVYDTIESRTSYLDERVDRIYRRCDY